MTFLYQWYIAVLLFVYSIFLLSIFLLFFGSFLIVFKLYPRINFQTLCKPTFSLRGSNCYHIAVLQLRYSAGCPCGVAPWSRVTAACVSVSWSLIPVIRWWIFLIEDKHRVWPRWSSIKLLINEDSSLLYLHLSNGRQSQICKHARTHTVRIL